MTGGHHLVRHELSGLVAAEMAVETDLRTFFSLLQRNHAERHIAGVRGFHRVMRCQPGAGCAMAGFAPDPIRNLELRAARVRLVGMATQTVGRLFRRTDAKARRDRFAARLRQPAPRAAVRAQRRALVLPAANFVLPHDATVWCQTGVTGRSCARRDTLVYAALYRRTGSPWNGGQCQQHAKDGFAGRSTPAPAFTPLQARPQTLRAYLSIRLRRICFSIHSPEAKAKAREATRPESRSCDPAMRRTPRTGDTCAHLHSMLVRLEFSAPPTGVIASGNSWGAQCRPICWNGRNPPWGEEISLLHMISRARALRRGRRTNVSGICRCWLWRAWV